MERNEQRKNEQEESCRDEQGMVKTSIPSTRQIRTATTRTRRAEQGEMMDEKRIPKAEVVPGDNRALSKKDYDVMLVEYANQVLKPEEVGVYTAMKNSLIQKYKLVETNDLAMLDMACYDYIRIKRLQKMITDEGDIITVDMVSKAGNKYSFRKVHEASYLLNAVQTQFRNTMKELMLTKKEQMKVKIGKDDLDFSKFMTVEAEVKDDGK